MSYGGEHHVQGKGLVPGKYPVLKAQSAAYVRIYCCVVCVVTITDPPGVESQLACMLTLLCGGGT